MKTAVKESQFSYTMYFDDDRGYSLYMLKPTDENAFCTLEAEVCLSERQAKTLLGSEKLILAFIKAVDFQKIHRGDYEGVANFFPKTWTERLQILWRKIAG